MATGGDADDQPPVARNPQTGGDNLCPRHNRRDRQSPPPQRTYASVERDRDALNRELRDDIRNAVRDVFTTPPPAGVPTPPVGVVTPLAATASPTHPLPTINFYSPSEGTPPAAASLTPMFQDARVALGQQVGPAFALGATPPGGATTPTKNASRYGADVDALQERQPAPSANLAAIDRHS